MSSEVLSLASEILSMDGLSRGKVRKLLASEYGVTDKETVDAVIACLDGEGYWG